MYTLATSEGHDRVNESFAASRLAAPLLGARARLYELKAEPDLNEAKSVVNGTNSAV